MTVLDSEAFTSSSNQISLLATTEPQITLHCLWVVTNRAMWRETGSDVYLDIRGQNLCRHVQNNVSDSFIHLSLIQPLNDKWCCVKTPLSVIQVDCIIIQLDLFTDDLVTPLTHPPNKRKHISKPTAHHFTLFQGNMFVNPVTVVCTIFRSDVSQLREMWSQQSTVALHFTEL